MRAAADGGEKAAQELPQLGSPAKGRDGEIGGRRGKFAKGIL